VRPTFGTRLQGVKAGVGVLAEDDFADTVAFGFSIPLEAGSSWKWYFSLLIWFMPDGA